ncbi:MAG: integrase [Polaromonas sp. 39-63-203]|jgi:integrase|uniref:tyrosine-type recombinase/integrase n=1 Tax=Polaromonas sp. TaxID=1869339 RepID=UPI000BDB0894|nr:integrase arm-type DNA-binding domain-containing protein [Polaromonas sp.]OYY50164.1 MAG: integrase [Polaromonas sp. 35-63-240]OYZ80186.1 MAG: integrase [Polaromonas sp. 24-62-144]OZA95223.1 MAG: integrase [Polaromonas sp. 39-63-203]HQS33051.1 integrase arm-type DNA-binding domain-containing protein [Polaromonas sp.]HQS92277.1 integrase arm-type DNA-binding domain-containing protein [Polaromonas sp.]
MLTDTAIKKAKPTEKPYKLTDERGLHLLIQTTGAKLWQLRYRHGGREKKASLGQYPDVGLSDAREKRDELRKIIAAGADPIATKRAERDATQAAEVNTFESVARAWWEHWRATRSDSHTGYVIRRLEADVFPAIGTRPISAIEAPELVAMAKAIEKRGALDIAKRALQTTGQVFRYAIAHGKATRNPATDIKPADVLRARVKSNYARVDATELPALLRKIDAYQGTPTTRLAVKLMALTFVRTGELIGARWSEFDVDAARWDIPAARMKMKTPHVVPLSPHAIDVLRTLHTVTGGRELLFPGERDHDKPMSNNTILGALARMGYKHRMTGHGFRGVASEPVLNFVCEA